MDANWKTLTKGEIIMSTNLKNEIRKAPMRNFTTYTIERYLIIENESLNEQQKDEFVKKINEELWYAIQETNAVFEDRILPYVLVRRAIKDKHDTSKLRIIINDLDDDTEFGDLKDITSIKISDLSHLINFKTLAPQRRVIVSDERIPGNARIIIDIEDQISAAVDIFLDIAVFNSIPTLSQLSLKEKQKFSQTKLDFYKNQNLNSYYFIDPVTPPSYFSLSFSARIDKKTIDYNKYKYLWDKFLETYKYKSPISNIPITNQISYHVDINNLPASLQTTNYWKSYNGAYLLLRINKKPNDIERENILCNFFGITTFNIGEIKIVPLSNYYNSYIRKQMNELIVSAFKVIV